MRHVVSMFTVLWLAMPVQQSTAADSITIPDCWLSLKEEVQVPAQEAGVLMKIPVREGQPVAAGDLLAQIDDVLTQRQYDVANFKLEAAKRQAGDDVDVRYAILAAKVAENDYRKALEANRQHDRTVPQIEVDRKKLEWDKYVLSIEKSQKDIAVAKLQAMVAEAELRAAKANVERRRLTAPLDAMVIELSRHEGEWVQAGDPVMRLVRVDLLRVEGVLSAKQFHPSEIQGRPVEVAVTLAGGQRETFPGKIVFVNPLVQAGDSFQVRAEVQNRQRGNAWALSPGMHADMTIQLK